MKAKPKENREKNDHFLIRGQPYGLTLTSKISFRTRAPLSSRRRRWIWSFSSGTPSDGLPATVSGKSVLPIGFPVISGGFRRQESGKNLKHGPFAYFFSCDLL
jgi:hypothetical protein